MFKVVPWSSDLELSQFYNDAAQRGFINNSSEEQMINCLKDEQRWNTWIVYFRGRAVASSGAHSLGFMPGYRICARTCVLTDLIGINISLARKTITKHQMITPQIFMPTAIEWAGKGEDIYITTHDTDVAGHKKVHTTYMPMLEKQGTFTRYADIEYRGKLQTFWRVNVDVLYQQLEDNVRWPYYLPS